MTYQEFTQRSQALAAAPVQEQKDFYTTVLQTEQAKSEVRMLAYFRYALLFYNTGDYHTAREVLEPFIIEYKSYPYRIEIISCFNLIGIACLCDGEYPLARFYLNEALSLCKKKDAKARYSYEYNNLSLSYIGEQDYQNALDCILKAEQHLPDCTDDIPAYVYANMAQIYCFLDRPQEAKAAFEKFAGPCRGATLLPEDEVIYGTLLFHKLGDARYPAYRAKLLVLLPQLYSTNFTDAMLVLFLCAKESGRDADMQEFFSVMDTYLAAHPEESRIGLQLEQFKYTVAEARRDKDAMLAALQKREIYHTKLAREAEQLRVRDVGRYFSIGLQLQKAVASEARANHAKTMFLANMSHDIRTPINGIMGMVAMIESCRRDEKKVDDCLSKIDLSAHHLLSLVNDVLDMTKLESGATTIDTVPFDLDRVCADTCKIVYFQAEQAGLHVQEQHDDIRGLHLLGHELYLRKILVNLFSNSIKYNKPGGTIYTQLRIKERTDDKVVCEFSIRDTGIGMTPEFVQDHLFEPFVQGGNTSRSQYGGTGLGMSIVKQLVTRMQGTITVDSAPGRGTRFTVVLPFAIDHNAQPAAPAPEQPLADLHGRRLLVVEDNELNLEIAEFMLQQSGAAVTCARNGQEALDLYRAAPASFDAILMDLMMPVMDGCTAAKAIRSSGLPGAGTIPILAMSANAYAEDVEHCLASGMNAHLSKPLFRDTLLAALGRYLH